MIVNPGKFQAIVVKLACVVNIKLGFMNQLFRNLIMLIKWCKIQYWNLDKALAFPRNQIICLKKWKPWQTPTAIKFNIFGWIYCFILWMSIKRYVGFFLFCLFCSWFIDKPGFCRCVETRYFFILPSNSSCKTHKNIPHTLL